MSDLIVIAFDDEADAFSMRQELIKAQGAYLVELEDAVVVTRPSEGEYQLHQAANLTAAGAIGGTFWGGLIGLLFLNPLLGAAIGAGAGALAGSATDYGIPDDFIREIGKTVPVGSGAVFILSRKLNLDKLLPRVEQYGSRARLIQTSLSNDDEARLRSALAGAAAAPLAASSVPAAGQVAGQPAGQSGAQPAGTRTADVGAAAARSAQPQPPHAAGDDDDTPAEPTAPPRL